MSLRIALIIGLLAGHVLGWLARPASAWAVSTSVVISEVQTGGVGSGHAGDEFIELYNPSVNDISLEKWTLKYRSASSSDCAAGWSTKLTFPKTTIKSHGFYLVAATGYLAAADSRYSSGLSSTAGAVRLADNGAQIIDTVGWGSVNACAEGTFAAGPGDGRSLERRPGVDNESGGNATDTDDNSADFIVRVTPGPQDSAAAPETPSVADQQLAGPTVYLPLDITEALVDPVSPQTDASHEFIELHNPNTEAVQVNDYVVKIGATTYHLPPAILLPNAFLTVTSASSHLSLANDGGAVTLLDPVGNELDVSASWTVAPPGAAWALFSDGWAWTATATPGAANRLTEIAGLGSTTSDPVGPPPDPAPAPTYLPLQLNEFLPDPTSPAVDSSDEFVELYNPNTQPVDVGGYVVKTGASLGNSVVLTSHQLGAGEYYAITSGETALTLSNAGSRVGLYDPAGAQLGETIAYPAALTGDAYALGPDGWAWTTTPTPGAANVMTVPVVAPVKATTTKAGARTTVSAGKVKAASVAKVAKTPKPTKTPAVKKVAVKKSSKATKPLADVTVPHQSWLLFALAGLTIAYIIYEFRYDLRNYLQKLRRHPSPSR